MPVIVIGEILCPSGLNFCNMQVEIKHTGSVDFAYVYYSGANLVFVYKILSGKESISDELCINQRVTCMYDQSSATEQKHKITYMESFVLPFPVYFICITKESVWAVGLDNNMLNLNDTISNSYKHESCTSGREIWNCTVEELEKSEPVENLLLINLLNSKVARDSLENKNRLSSASQLFADGLVLCYKNIFRSCFVIKAFISSKLCIHFPEVSYSNDFTTSYSMSEISKLGVQHQEARPVLVCIGVKGSAIKNVLSTGSFVSFFGTATLLSCNSVLLFGVPDGRVLWYPFHSLTVHSSCLSKQCFNILCDIEEPVKGIHVYTSTDEDNGINSDGLIIVGAFGKVIILLPSDSVTHSKDVQEALLYTVHICFIPFPVYENILIKNYILHTCTDGQLWISELHSKHTEKLINESREDAKNKYCTDIPTLKIDFIARATVCMDIMLLLSLDENRGMIMYVTFTGQVYIRCIFEDSYIYSKKVEKTSVLLDYCYRSGAELLPLQSVIIKQQLLFAQLAALIDLKHQGDNFRKRIICHINKLDSQKFILCVSAECLNTLKLDSALWNLTACIWKVNKESSVIVKSVPYVQGVLLFLELDSSYLDFGNSSCLPFAVEIGLSLNVPLYWRKKDFLKPIIDLFPIYFPVKHMLIHGLYFITIQNRINSYDTISDYKLYENNQNINFLIQQLFKNENTNLDSIAFKRKYDLLNKFVFKSYSTDFYSLWSLPGCNSVCSVKENQSLLYFDYPVSISTVKHEHYIVTTIEADNIQVILELKFAVIRQFLIMLKTSLSADVKLASSLSKKIEVLLHKVMLLLLKENTVQLSNETILETFQALRKEISTELFF